MKKILIATTCMLALSTAVALAQSSQGDAGPGTMNNKTMTNDKAGSGSGMSNSTTGSSMGSGSTTGANSNMGGNSNMGTMNNGGMNADGVARNPSSQGNVGPGTDNNRPGSTK